MHSTHPHLKCTATTAPNLLLVKSSRRNIGLGGCTITHRTLTPNPPLTGWCMIKIFWGAGVVTPSKPPHPYEQLLPLPTPYFKMFLERSLNDPHPQNQTSSTFHCYPLPIHHPFPPKNFDHTLAEGN